MKQKIQHKKLQTHFYKQRSKLMELMSLFIQPRAPPSKYSV